MNKLKALAKKSTVLLGVILLCVGSIAASKSRKSQPTQSIAVSFTNPDLKFLNRTEVLHLIENYLDTLQGIQLREMDLQELEQVVTTNDYVENCEAFINNNSQLKLSIQQKQPLFRVIHHNNVSYYVDNKGIKFPKSSTFTANVPIVQGKILYDVDSLGVQQSGAINNLVTLFAYVNSREEIKALIASAFVQNDGDIVIIPRIGTHRVNIGSVDNLEDKLNRLLLFYQKGLTKLGWQQYDEINLKYSNQIIAKKKGE